MLAAFGAAGVRLVPFGGGQATSWHAGDLVLKPADLDRENWNGKPRSPRRFPAMDSG